MKRIVMTAIAATLARRRRRGAGAGQDADGVRGERRLRLLEAGRGRREEGAGRAGDDYDLQFRYPAQATAALQNALMDDLVAAGTDAIMISSVDPKTSIDAFNRIAAQVALFTTDSDAPQSNRIAYIGSSNTDAGVQAGEIAVKALPDGGKCMGFVGLLGADNAKERIAGFRKAVEGHNIELVDVRGDDIDFARARSNVDDVLAANPEITCMVGLLFLQLAEDLRGAAGGRQARPDHRRRLRRGPDHPRRGQGRHLRRHRGAAAVRVGLPGHEADGRLPRGDKSGSRPTA